MKIFKQIESYKKRIAIESNGKQFTYAYLIEKSDLIASFLLNEKKDLKEEKIGLLMNADIDYICTLWGIWKAGGVAVPLSLSAKQDELKHYISDCDIKLIISSNIDKRKQVIPKENNLVVTDIEEINTKEKKQLPSIKSRRKAMILYTSGTTSKPKGVVSTHKNVESQITTLAKAWEWTQEDHIPLFLPLHHIHGIINSLSCPLYVGAKVTMMGQFDTEKVCSEVASKDFTVFTAVPTIYFSLIEKLENSQNKKLFEGFKRMRLMMSGSAALAPEIHKKWKELTGQELLERYGMTEVGMALSNKINGERRPGSVGVPLPGVEVKIEDDRGRSIEREHEAGLLLIKGPQVFLEYLNLPQKTKESFQDDWFISGDVVMLEEGYYKILGRDSIDIIKSGGYKISALEIEDILLRNPGIKECAVVGIEDEKWGEIIASGIVLKQKKMGIVEIKDWCSKHLSSYKIPRNIKILDELPKNSMGKVTKPKLKKILAN
tara:strand:- start:241 stop:1710 length:1470 start_codon:yes stop_codon:yes gene_type:complete